MKKLWSTWQRQRIYARLARLELLVLDVDGVLTDGGLWFNPDGQLQKRFDVRDGLGIRLLQQAGLKLAFLRECLTSAIVLSSSNITADNGDVCRGISSCIESSVANKAGLLCG